MDWELRAFSPGEFAAPRSAAMSLLGIHLMLIVNSTSDWCMLESLSWVGSDVVRPDCTVDPSDPSCTDPTNVTAENQRIANLYNNTMLCSDCFLSMFYQRLSSDYLPDSNYSDYLVSEFQGIQDVCSTTVGNLSTVAQFALPSAFPATNTLQPYNETTTDTGAAATSTAAASGSAAAASTTVAATTTSTSITTPTPTQTGMVSDCDDFYEAVSGDSCYNIAEAKNITLTDFETWNPAVGANCTDLYADYYYCIGIVLDTSSSACQVVNTTLGVTNSTIACEQLSLLWGVTTGDLLQYTGGATDCYTEDNICLPAACSLMQVPQNSTWYVSEPPRRKPGELSM